MSHSDRPPLRIGIIQGRAGDDPAENLETTIRRIAEAAERGARIVCLQELFRTRYFCQEEDARHFGLAETVPGDTTRRLAEAAVKHQVAVIGSVFERRAAGLFHNTAVLIGADGRIEGLYRKMHIPDDPRFYEKFYFTPGDLGFPAFDAANARIGMLVCWDQWFPEAARLVALAGAQVVFYPTAIGTWTGELDLLPVQHQAWQMVQRAHAVTNGMFVVAVNRVGVEGDLRFWGRSFVARPDGTLATELEQDDEEVRVLDLDLDLVDEAREGWPFLRDRRIDAYGDLLRRYRDDDAGV